MSVNINVLIMLRAAELLLKRHQSTEDIYEEAETRYDIQQYAQAHGKASFARGYIAGIHLAAPQPISELVVEATRQIAHEADPEYPTYIRLKAKFEEDKNVT